MILAKTFLLLAKSGGKRLEKVKSKQDSINLSQQPGHTNH